jgi:hypothetical protein
MAHIPNPTYANTTITSGGLSSGSGITYSSGTNTWQPSNHASGVIYAKDFVIDGELSLREVLEQRLNMLVPNPEMEREWKELKELGEAYRQLEAECIEKSKMWKTLKKTA